MKCLCWDFYDKPLINLVHVERILHALNWPGFKRFCVVNKVGLQSSVGRFTIDRNFIKGRD